MVVSLMVAIPFVALIIVRLDRTAAPNSSVNGTQSDFRCGTARRRGPPGKSHAMAPKRGHGLSTHRPCSSPISRAQPSSVPTQTPKSAPTSASPALGDNHVFAQAHPRDRIRPPAGPRVDESYREGPLARFCVAVLPVFERLRHNETRRIGPDPNSATTVGCAPNVGVRSAGGSVSSPEQAPCV